MKTQIETIRTDLGYANDSVRKLKYTNQIQKEEIQKLTRKKIDKTTQTEQAEVQDGEMMTDPLDPALLPEGVM
jgi:hypothetical protein